MVASWIGELNDRNVMPFQSSGPSRGPFAANGLRSWPTASPSLVALVDEYELPLPDASIDRVLLVHEDAVHVHQPGADLAPGVAFMKSSRCTSMNSGTSR